MIFDIQLKCNKVSQLTCNDLVPQMENLNQMEILTKFGILCKLKKFNSIGEILPFLGKFSKWKYLLVQLSKKTKQIWTESEEGFQELFYSTCWKTETDQVVEIIKDKVDPYINPSETSSELGQYTLEICCGSPHTAKCFSDTSEIIFPPIKGLTIYNFDATENKEFEKEIKHFFNVLSIPTTKSEYKIQNLRVVCGFQTNFNIDVFKKILPKVKNRLLLSLFNFTKESFLDLISSCRKINTIVLAACKVPSDVEFDNSSIQNFDIKQKASTGMNIVIESNK